jgi:hypothetical protein
VEVAIRAARVPASLKRAVREENIERILKCLAEWLVGYFAAERQTMREDDLTQVLGSHYAWRSALKTSIDRFMLDPKTRSSGAAMQRETPLTADDITFLRHAPSDPASLAKAKRPRMRQVSEANRTHVEALTKASQPAD